MRLSTWTGCAAVAGMVLALAAPRSQAEESVTWKSVPGTYARFETSEGTIVCRLFEKQAPLTVKNFVELAEGKKEFTDPVARSKAMRPYYDGTKFHRIIPNFMIQGGDPTATGAGGPGFTIPDEFDSSLDFSKPGILAMANVGRPNTGGAQFFITQVPTPWLNGKHTIFGEVVDGQAIVNKIAGLGSQQGKPSKDVNLNKVVIERVAAQGSK